MSNYVTHFFTPSTYVPSSPSALAVTYFGEMVLEIAYLFPIKWPEKQLWDGVQIVDENPFGELEQLIEVPPNVTFDAETGFAAIENLGGSLEGGVLTQKVDEGDRTWWETIDVWEWGETGMVYKETVRDNGINKQVLRTGEGDARIVWKSDTKDKKGWSLEQKEYDANGTLASETLYRDDGRRAEMTYDGDGVLREKTLLDIADVYDFVWKRKLWDETGELTQTEVLHDDGVLVMRAFEDGVKRSEMLFDAEDAYDFSSISRTYDEAGALVEERSFPDPILINEEFPYHDIELLLV